MHLSNLRYDQNLQYLYDKGLKQAFFVIILLIRNLSYFTGIWTILKSCRI